MKLNKHEAKLTRSQAIKYPCPKDMMSRIRELINYNNYFLCGSYFLNTKSKTKRLVIQYRDHIPSMRLNQVRACLTPAIKASAGGLLLNTHNPENHLAHRNPPVHMKTRNTQTSPAKPPLNCFLFLASGSVAQPLHTQRSKQACQPRTCVRGGARVCSGLHETLNASFLADEVSGQT